MRQMRPSDGLFLFIGYLLVWISLLGCDALRLGNESRARIAQESSLVADYGLTDLCLTSEARYTRHPSQADLHSAFQDHPLALEHFPSGSLIPPPAHLGLTEQEVLVLEMVIRSGAMSPAEVAKQTGLPPGSVDPILERLVRLHYVSRRGVRYKAEARPRGL